MATTLGPLTLNDSFDKDRNDVHALATLIADAVLRGDTPSPYYVDGYRTARGYYDVDAALIRARAALR